MNGVPTSQPKLCDRRLMVAIARLYLSELTARRNDG